jgi:hypothetical protein
LVQILLNNLNDSEQKTLGLLYAITLGFLADGEHSFAQLLRHGRYHACGQPLDRVYGFLGLLSQSARTQYRVSYSSASKERYWNVYVQAAKMVSYPRADSQSSSCDAMHKPTLDLPSWCPNYNCEPECKKPLEVSVSDPLLWPTRIRHDYQAGVDLKSISLNRMQIYQRDIPFDAQNPYEVQVARVQVDEIVRIVTAERWQWPWHASTWDLQRAHKTANWLSRCCDLTSLTLNVDLLTLRVFSEMLAGFVQPPDILEELCTSPYEQTLKVLALADGGQLRSIFLALRKDSPEIFWFINCIYKLWGNRVFFVTRNGRIGAASRLVQCGGKVCILFGGKAVYVLRKRPQGPNWQFLHAAYVHGLMSGEVFGMLDRGEAQQEYFTINYNGKRPQKCRTETLPDFLGLKI